MECGGILSREGIIDYFSPFIPVVAPLIPSTDDRCEFTDSFASIFTKIEKANYNVCAAAVS